MHPMQYAGLAVQPVSDPGAPPGRDDRGRLPGVAITRAAGATRREGHRHLRVLHHDQRAGGHRLHRRPDLRGRRAGRQRPVLPTHLGVADRAGVGCAASEHPGRGPRIHQPRRQTRADLGRARRINAARVLLHEAAHVVLHGPDSGFITTEQYAASRAHRGTAEIQADGAAYVLADLLGLDTRPASVGYVAGWATAAAGSTTDTEAITAAVPRRSAWTTENNPR